ncbi:hypothetical protein BZG35_16450 [Brevundimonas sp. LM2]|uniref:winged helix-turn-helix domain-containing protein n=1 Tax=Brevundimonas sp. LM2 TaxID=1938605 RepID=UPI0009839B53|nr:winged helix-turn-helix domain-containing protein [Brevundimonas sp. LM2]AQR63070.1 hypothetical protein BZG35_16450 [Brevundimonas sp. LM2]
MIDLFDNVFDFPRRLAAATPGVQHPTTQTVLVFEDDAEVRTLAIHSLQTPSWRVVALAKGTDFETSAREFHADLIVLGAMKTTQSDVSSSLRQTFGTPIVPLFRPSVYARQGVRPTKLASELVLGLLDCRIRIRQHLGASSPPREVAVRWGDFTLKLEPSAFVYRGHGLHLTRVQGAIMSLLMLHAGEVVSSRMIENVVFQAKPRSATNFIPVHISRLRAKLRENRSGVFIENVRGIGYALFWNPSFSTESIPAPHVFVPRPEDQERLRAKAEAISIVSRPQVG